MTLPSSGYLTLNDPADPTRSINSEFGYGNNLLAYVGKQWWTYNSGTGAVTTGFFSAPVVMPGDFYGKRGTSPVSPSSTKISYSGASNQYSTTFTVPLYAVLTVIVRGGAGGGGGGGGNLGNGDNGSSGYGSYFWTGSYSAGVGTGGTSGGNSPYSPGTAGAGSDGYPAGGSGGSGGGGGNSGYSGGAGGKQVYTFVNPLGGAPGTPGPSVGATITVVIGKGGAGGSGGLYSYVVAGETYYANAGSGSNGGNGYIEISWT